MTAALDAYEAPHWCQNPETPNGYSFHDPAFGSAPWPVCTPAVSMVTGESLPSRKTSAATS